MFEALHICGAKANAMDSENKDAVALLLAAFTKALSIRDHEALDVQLAPWISVSEALELAKDQEFDVFIGDQIFPDVADQLPPRVDADNFIAWAVLGNLDAAVVKIAGGLYVGYLG
jgi:hypothetical protein